MARSYSAAPSTAAKAKVVLKSDVGKIAALLLCLTVFANLFSLLFSFLFAMGAAFAAAAEQQAISPQLMEELMTELPLTPLGNFFMSCLPVIAADVVVILMAKKMLSFPLQQPLFQKPAKKGMVFWGTLSTAGMTIFGLVGTSLLIGLFSLFGLTVMGPDLSIAESDPVSNALMLFYACILAPVMEEIIFRGYLLRRLQRHGKLFAVLFTSILFAMFHANLIQFCTPFFLGLLLAFITLESESLWPAVVAHAFNNIAAFAISYIGNEVAYYIVYILYLLIGLYALRHLYLKHAPAIKEVFRGKSSYLSAGQQWGAVCSSILFWVYTVVYLIGVVILFWAA